MCAAGQLRLLEDVVPQRRAALEPGAECRQLAELSGGKRADAHRPCDVLTRRQRPRDVAQEIALRQRGRRITARDRAERQIEEWRRDLRVDQFVRPNVGRLIAAEVEERLPADEASSASVPRRADRPGRLALPGRIEDEREERLATVAGQVGAIRRPHDAVAESIGHLEFDRNAGLASTRPVEPPAFCQDVVDQLGADDARQELVQDDPLVVPRDEAPCFGEHIAEPRGLPDIVERIDAGGRRGVFRFVIVAEGEPLIVAACAQHVDDAIVEHRNAACRPPMMTCSSFRGSGMIADPLDVRGRSSKPPS